MAEKVDFEIASEKEQYAAKGLWTVGHDISKQEQQVQRPLGRKRLAVFQEMNENFRKAGPGIQRKGDKGG